jgi:hypothetical protein
MKKYSLLILIISPIISFSQKVKVDKKTNQVTVDGVYSFKMDRTGCGFAWKECYYEVFDTTGKKGVRINFREFNSPVEVKPSNPQGRVTYLEFIFLESKQKAEIGDPGLKEEKVAKLVAKNGLFVNGVLNAKAVDDFVLINGTPFLQRVKF